MNPRTPKLRITGSIAALSLSSTYTTDKLPCNVPLNSRARCYGLVHIAQGIVTATLPGGEGLKVRQVNPDPRHGWLCSLASSWLSVGTETTYIFTNLLFKEPLNLH